MEEASRGYVSCSEAICEIVQAFWPIGVDAPDSELDDRFLAICDFIVLGLRQTPPLIARLVDQSDQAISPPKGHWGEKAAYETVKSGRLDGAHLFFLRSSWEDWKRNSFGESTSAYIHLPGAFRIVGIMTGMGKAKARDAILWKLRDGLLVARGVEEMDAGPRVFDLDQSWWNALEYREGANVVAYGDRRLYPHHDDKGRMVAPPLGQPLPRRIAREVSVKRVDLLKSFGIEIARPRRPAPVSPKALSSWLNAYAEVNRDKAPPAQEKIIEDARLHFGKDRISRDGLREAIRLHSKLGRSKRGRRT